MRLFAFLFLLSVFSFSQTALESVPWKREGFDSEILVRRQLPDNFSLHHIVSFGMSANSLGYARSGGSYTSVMEYYITPNVTLFAAIGFSTTFWSTQPEYHPNPHSKAMQTELNIPFIALDWRVSDNVNVHFMISDGSCMDETFCSPYGRNRMFYRNAIFRQ